MHRAAGAAHDRHYRAHQDLCRGADPRPRCRSGSRLEDPPRLLRRPCHAGSGRPVDRGVALIAGAAGGVMTAVEPPITEADIDWAAEIAEADEAARADWDYFEEIRSCCGGRSWACIHYRSYPPPREWEQP